LAEVEVRNDHPELGEKLYQQCLAAHRDAKNRRSVGSALAGLAWLYLRTGRHDDSRVAFTKALEIAVEVKDRRSEGTANCRFALLHVAQANAQAAQERWTQGE